MSKYANFLWWLSYIVLAIYFQTKVQGFDAFLPGFLVALQENKMRQTAYVTLVFFLIQDGMGSMNFGTVFLWYFSVIVIYIAMQWIFEVESLIFILLISFISSFLHHWIIILMATLQDMHISQEVIFEQNVYQAFLTPLIWALAHFSRRGFHHETKS